MRLKRLHYNKSIMPAWIAISIAKVIIALSRSSGRGGGSALPGVIAQRLRPGLARQLAMTLPDGVVLVTGTNGKTTATKMLQAVMQSAGGSVLSNRTGSNLYQGIVSSMVEHASVSGRLPARMAVFEVDEATLPRVAAELAPKLIVVMNLYRDQLDRYGELDTTARMIGQAIEVSGAGVLLNADDPLVASLSAYVKEPAKLHYFGVESTDVVRMKADTAADSDHCPKCGRALDYSRNFFGHIGHYRCSKGDFARPKPDVSLRQESGEAGDKYELRHKGQDYKLRLGIQGLYNGYNALAAFGAAMVLGVAGDRAVAALAKVDAAFGRVEKFEYKGRNVVILLVKNPTGFNQIIQTFLLTAKKPTVLIAANDNDADGRDVSWYWDVGFESMEDSGARVVCTGVRAYDMALRLKYAGLASEVVSPPAEALDKLVRELDAAGTLYVLPTYTAMLDLRKLMERQADLKGIWQ